MHAGDLVYLFCAERNLKLLDNIYAGKDVLNDRELRGDFSLMPGATINSVADRYGIAVPADLHNCTLEQAFQRRLRGRVELGDRLPLGPYELIVRDISRDGDIVEVGLLIDDPDAAWR